MAAKTKPLVNRVPGGDIEPEPPMPEVEKTAAPADPMAFLRDVAKTAVSEERSSRATIYKATTKEFKDDFPADPSAIDPRPKAEAKSAELGHNLSRWVPQHVEAGHGWTWVAKCLTCRGIVSADIRTRINNAPEREGEAFYGMWSGIANRKGRLVRCTPPGASNKDAFQPRLPGEKPDAPWAKADF